MDKISKIELLKKMDAINIAYCSIASFEKNEMALPKSFTFHDILEIDYDILEDHYNQIKCESK